MNHSTYHLRPIVAPPPVQQTLATPQPEMAPPATLTSQASPLKAPVPSSAHTSAAPSPAPPDVSHPASPDASSSTPALPLDPPQQPSNPTNGPEIDANASTSDPSSQPSSQQQTQDSTASSPIPPVLAPHHQAPAPYVPPPLIFDVVAEAGKVPLEVAICNSVLSLPSEDKVKRMTSSLLLVGGTASLPALGYALQSRYVNCFPFSSI